MPKLTNEQKRTIALTGSSYGMVDKNTLIASAQTEHNNLRQMLFDDKAVGEKYEAALANYLALNYAIQKRDKEEGSPDMDAHKEAFSIGLDDLDLSEKEVGDFYQQMDDPEFDPQQAFPLEDTTPEVEAKKPLKPIKEEPKVQKAVPTQKKAPVQKESDTIEKVPDYNFPDIVKSRTTTLQYMVYMSDKFNESRNYAVKQSKHSFLNFAGKFADSTKKTTENAKDAYDKSISDSSIAGDGDLNVKHQNLANHEALCLRGIRPMLHDQYKKMSFFRNPIDKMKCFFLMKKIDNRIQKIDPGVDKATLDNDLNTAQRFFVTQPGEAKVKDVYVHPEQRQQEVLKEQAMFSRKLSQDLEKKQAQPEISQKVQDAPAKNVDLGPKKD